MNYLQRKRMALMMNRKFRGYLRTVSGYPLTITDSVGGNMVSLSIVGKAVQDGTPSPDNPVEIVGVGDYDEASGKYAIPISIQSENGTSTVCDIYLDKPLYSSGSVSDSITVDWTNKTAVRTNKTHCFKMLASQVTSYRTIRLPITGVTGDKAMTTIGSTNISSSMYTGVNIANSVGATTVAEFKEYLNTHDIYALYRLGTPVTTDISDKIDWNSKIKTPKGTSTITALTTVLPTEMSGTYYAETEE